MSWGRALRETARAGMRVERTALTPLIAVRGACGVALVVGLALWLGSPTLAVSSAFGAFASGIATFLHSWRPRPVRALAAAGGLAVSTFLAYLCVPWDVAFLVLLAVWTFGAGLAWAVGPTSGAVAALTVAVMLVAVTLPDTVRGALTHAALIAVGGLVQAALIVLFPVRPWGARRDALADALAAVADYARRLRHDPTAPFDPEALMEARTAAAVTPREARRRPRQLGGYRALAERFRPLLGSLADPFIGGVPAEGPERERVRALLAASATVLDASARAIRRGEPVRIPEAALTVLQVPDSGPVLSGAARKSALRLIALTDEAVEAAREPVEVTRTLPVFGSRTVWIHADEPPGDDPADGGSGAPRARRRSGDRRPYQAPPDETAAEDGTDDGGSGGTGRAAGTGRGGVRRLLPGRFGRRATRGTPSPRHLHRPTVPGLVPVATRALRRELHWSSPVLRHALRLAVVVVVGQLVGELVLPDGHGYWIPLTAVMVLRPDFSQTFERGVSRFTGTLGGVVLAGAVVALADPGPYPSAVLAVVSLGLMYLLLSTNYALVSACTAGYVVFLLGVAGSEWGQTLQERVLLTAAGGLLAMLGYALFPAWETPRLRDRLADWLTANGRYAVAVLDAAERPGARTAREVRDALLDARAARREWGRTAERAGAEPVRHRGLDRRAARDAQLSLVTMGRVLMLLEAHLPEHAGGPTGTAATDPDPRTPAKGTARVDAGRGGAAYALALAAAMEPNSRAVRDGEPLDWTPVRSALDAWRTECGTADPVALRVAELLTDALEEFGSAVAPRAGR
ncbi:FUSC family protein [Streptomyces phytohabitans]|uniref:FUSC family protein n=1 Tax=Streptomyces phytohabitans TaxID=1150371 RepID=UPI00345C069D